MSRPWVTRQRLHVDRTACPWLIRRFVDPVAAFAFVPPGTDPRSVEGISFDLAGADYGHEGVKCTFEVILERHGLTGDAALVELGRIIRDADVPYSRVRCPESAGLDAIISGLREAVPDDHEKLRLSGPLYDGLYAYCQLKVAAGRRAKRTPGRPKLRYARRVADHLAGRDEADGG